MSTGRTRHDSGVFPVLRPMSEPEIADVLGLTRRQVMRILRRAERKLRHNAAAMRLAREAAEGARQPWQWASTSGEAGDQEAEG